jgi:hypothetical protein
MDEMNLPLFSDHTHFVVAELSGKKDFHSLLLQDLLPRPRPRPIPKTKKSLHLFTYTFKSENMTVSIAC